jgi:hypothetical protein
MDLTFVSSPLFLAITGIGAVFLFLLFTSSLGQTKRARQVQLEMQQAARRQNQKKVTVLIELTRRADSCFALLDHLAAQNYRHLQVVVVVKQTAGKNALPSVRRYAKSLPLNLVAVKHTKGLSKQDAVRQHASGSLIVWLRPDEHLTDNFFEEVSLFFITASVGALQLRRQVELGDSLYSALSAWKAMLLPANDTPCVYRKSFYVKPRAYLTRRAINQAIISPAVASKPKNIYDTLLSVLRVLLLVGIAVGAIYFARQVYGGGYIVAAIFGAYLLLILSWQSSFRGYTLADRINLVLISPFLPIVVWLR